MRARLLLCVFLILLFTCGCVYAYDDTGGHWAETAIEKWSHSGLINGKGDGKFDPDGNMTRAEAAAVFSRLLKLEEKADISMFSDVEGDSWYYDVISKCVAAGILNGDSGQMKPNTPMTREMFCTMLARALNIIPEGKINKSFSDVDTVSSWAKNGMYAMVNQGWIKGVTETELAPGVSITRASVVTLIDRIISAYGADVLESPSGGVCLALSDCSVEEGFSGTVIVAAPNVKISFKGAKDCMITVNASGVEIKDAPTNSFVTLSNKAVGTVINGNVYRANCIFYVNNKEVIYMTTAENTLLEEYEKPVLDVVEFGKDDIIQTSNNDDDQLEWDDLY